MLDEIFSIYKKIYEVAFHIMDKIDEKSRSSTVRTIGIIVCIILFEYLYFTNADEVRLLFVILIAFLGAIAGIIASALLCLVFSLFARELIVAFLAFITIVPIAAIIGLTIYILYSIKIQM